MNKTAKLVTAIAASAAIGTASMSFADQAPNSTAATAKVTLEQAINTAVGNSSATVTSATLKYLQQQPVYLVAARSAREDKQTLIDALSGEVIGQASVVASAENIRHFLTEHAFDEEDENHHDKHGDHDDEDDHDDLF